MREDVDVAKELVFTAKVVLLAPPGMLTLAGTVAAAVLLLERVTTTPEDGAAALNVTVPWDVFPPTTLLGLSVTALTPAAAATVSVAVSVTPA
jgi:hypothetical protein